MRSLLLVLVLASASSAFGQAEPPSPFNGGGSRQERMLRFWQQFDANHDGQIDADEIQSAGPRGQMIESMIRRAGLEPKYPIKISDIQEAMEKARSGGEAGGFIGATPAKEPPKFKTLKEILEALPRKPEKDDNHLAALGATEWFQQNASGSVIRVTGRVSGVSTMRRRESGNSIVIMLDRRGLWQEINFSLRVSGVIADAENKINYYKIKNGDTATIEGMVTGAEIRWESGSGDIHLSLSDCKLVAANEPDAKSVNLFEATNAPKQPNTTKINMGTLTITSEAVPKPNRFWTGTTDTGVFAVRLDEIHFIQLIEAKSNNPPTWLMLILLKTKNDPIPVSFNDAEKAHAAYQSLLQALESDSARAIEGIGRNPEAGLRRTVKMQDAPAEKPNPPREKKEKRLFDANAEQPKAIAQPDAIKGSGILRQRLDRTGTSANLGGYQVTDADLEPLEEMPQLQSLFLANSQVTDAGLKHLRGLTDLQSLNLTFTRITDAGMDRVRGLHQLRLLSLHGMGITDAGLANLEGLTQLRSLNLYGTKVSNDWLKNLKNFPELRQLDLGTTGVSDAGLEPLKDLTKLQSLELIWTGIGDAGLKHLEGLTNLESLNLYNTRVTDAGLKSLAGMKKLESLNLDRTSISDAGIEHLEKLTGLKALGLRDTKLTDEGVKRLRKALPQCEIGYYRSQWQ